MGDADIEKASLDRIFKQAFVRLMPLLFIGYVMAYIDRINVGFAALKMNADLGIGPAVFGFGAGVFFIGYFFAEVPSNLIMEKVGARRWIARIMISWGLISAAMIFVQGEKSFLAMRLLLGAAEAGFYPGVILYMTYWFPKEYRARMFGAFSVAIPVSLAIGAPLSTAILQLDGLMGLKGWQWLFILEGLPTSVFGILFLFMIPDRPKDATWLAPADRDKLQSILDEEKRSVAATHGSSLKTAFTDPRMAALSFIYFANTGANLGLAFFLPQILKSTGLTDMQSGLMTAVPYVFGTIGGLVFGYVSDRYNDRRLTLVTALIFTAIGMVGAGFLTGSLWAVAFMSLAAVGLYGAKAPFWALPSLFLTGSAAAAGIAVINCIGNLGGFVAPSIVGWVRQATGSFEAGLYFLGGMALAGAITTILVVNQRFADAREPRGTLSKQGA
ncbi:MFS transporter [Methylobacterium sp. C25]|uniref:MFS transporter n=1 Tax=Methylobacterium sp. C25 TaxID=2721622 RepID=UPI001F3033BB|nr:MFS transporter [Methylobacterium sp. C25]MCE4225275.1 MFS transporter [Methylobacterium sp. C25]